MSSAPRMPPIHWWRSVNRKFRSNWEKIQSGLTKQQEEAAERKRQAKKHNDWVHDRYGEGDNNFELPLHLREPKNNAERREKEMLERNQLEYEVWAAREDIGEILSSCLVEIQSMKVHRDLRISMNALNRALACMIKERLERERYWRDQAEFEQEETTKKC